MTFDMYTKGATPKQEEALHQAACTAFDAAVAERNGLPGDPQQQEAQRKVDAAYDRMQKTHTSHFGLSNYGMGRYLDVMDRLGMLTTDYEPTSWPELPASLTWEDIDAAGEAPDTPDDTLPVKAAALDYLHALDAHLSWHPEHLTGIAAHKFTSNDGWHVTPKEIETALTAYRTHTGEEVKAILSSAEGGSIDIDRWMQWIAYLERSKEREGFEVH
ncbi:hypothetical protein OG730_41550 (plasmid) [Streptomyces sp. NBC_01298]|uniref:hypothetical protein n=1 Tax=Streptomyces sp. NBC_01298 TaxID=2903817 RepID=UPI002E1330AE|nr:hypothetical protein OG730_42475 [Streptomyces sp. NBC_01298]WSK25955.1 hypothetical protein OG730_41550 [Streptomyces sp. NBC_01298]